MKSKLINQINPKWSIFDHIITMLIENGYIASDMDFNINMAIIPHKIGDIAIQYCMLYQFCNNKANQKPLIFSKIQLINNFLKQISKQIGVINLIVKG